MESRVSAVKNRDETNCESRSARSSLGNRRPLVRATNHVARPRHARPCRPMIVVRGVLPAHRAAMRWLYEKGSTSVDGEWFRPGHIQPGPGAKSVETNRLGLIWATSFPRASIHVVEIRTACSKPAAANHADSARTSPPRDAGVLAGSVPSNSQQSIPGAVGHENLRENL
jgi:hypothetical protein